jgi:hypothetical protein
MARIPLYITIQFFYIYKKQKLKISLILIFMRVQTEVQLVRVVQQVITQTKQEVYCVSPVQLALTLLVRTLFLRFYFYIISK